MTFAFLLWCIVGAVTGIGIAIAFELWHETRNQQDR